MRYRVISFDAGFTLIEPVYPTTEVVRAIVEGAGFDAADAALEVGRHAAEQFFFASYELHGNTDWTGDDRIFNVWERYYAAFFTALEIPAAAHAGLVRLIVERYDAPENWRLFPEVADVLAELRGLGYRLCVVSDWNSGLPGILAHLGLLGTLDFVLASGTTGLAKPHPDFYRTAARHAGAPPEAILHIGDSFFADVSGARAAGMHGVLLDRAGQNPSVDCPIVRDLRGLLNMLKEDGADRVRLNS